jgi:signal transduction histidine kinase
MRVNEVAERFFASTELESLALVDQGRVCGLATRSKSFAILFRRFGFELFGKDPIIDIADRTPLVARDTDRLDATLALAMARSYQDIYDEVVVVDGDDRFTGLLSVRKMVMAQGDALALSILQQETALSRAREMQKVSDIKSQFIAHVTHELRSPLNAIIGIAELMRLSLEMGQHQQLSEKLALLSASAVGLRGIVTNILDISKIESGKMEVTVASVDLLPLLHEVADMTRILLGGKPVEVAVEAPARGIIITDEVKVRQVLVNLAGNAAKFTDNGRIVLGLTADAEGVAITVADTGIGIREEDREKLFLAFTQLEDAHTRRHEGTGLGLTITLQLLQLLGGAISVESTYGQGTTFTVRLPHTDPSEEACHNAHA